MGQIIARWHGHSHSGLIHTISYTKHPSPSYSFPTSQEYQLDCENTKVVVGVVCNHSTRKLKARRIMLKVMLSYTGLEIQAICSQRKRQESSQDLQFLILIILFHSASLGFKTCTFLHTHTKPSHNGDPLQKKDYSVTLFLKILFGLDLFETGSTFVALTGIELTM